MGPRLYNLFPLIAGSVDDWSRHLPRIARMGFDWIYLNPFHYPGFSGSLYAIKDLKRLHPVIDDGRPADAALSDFTARARDHGLSVMLDLVINHTAKDGLLVDGHPEWYRRDEDGELYSPRAVDPDDPENITIWGDLAELDYEDRSHHPAMLDFWGAYVDWALDRGFRGFRCDAAYQVPAEIWQPLIDRAKSRVPGVLFCAETLGCTTEQVDALAKAGFDYLFNSSKWWDFRAPWLLEQYDAFRSIAPSIAFPESHDTERLVAELGDSGPEAVERQYRQRYLFAAAFSAGIMMPAGYEFGFAEKLHVVDTRPADWAREADAPRFDLTGFIAAANAMKAAAASLNVEGAQIRLSDDDAQAVALLRYDAADPTAARQATLVLINPDNGQSAEASPGEWLASTGLGGFAEITPERPPASLDIHSTLTLAPAEIRVFSAGTEGRS